MLQQEEQDIDDIQFEFDDQPIIINPEVIDEMDIEMHDNAETDKTFEANEGFDEIVCEPDIEVLSDDSDLISTRKHPTVLSDSSESEEQDIQVDEDKVTSVQDIPDIDNIVDEVIAEVNDENIVLDELKRPHIKISRTGPGYIFFSSSQLNPSTSEAHVNDMLTIFEDYPELKKRFIVLVCDDGEFLVTMFFVLLSFQISGDDYSLRSLSTAHNFGRLFKEAELEGLVLVKYAPGLSRFNMSMNIKVDNIQINQ